MYDLYQTDSYCYIVPNGTAVITQCKIDNADVINVPEIIDGYKVTELYEYSFEYLSASEINLPEGLEVIGESAFKNCRNLKRINMPSTLKRILSYAFDSCNSLESVKLPNQVVLVAQAFYKCENLKKIEVNEDNETYYSIDGVLYIKDDNRLALYPLGKEDEEYSIPPKTASIVPYVFAFNVYVKKIIIPDTFKQIDPGAFSMAAALEEIKIPDTIENIGKQSFAHCISLSHIKLPHKLKVVDEEAFAQSGLTEIEIPEGTEVIESKAFYNCERLKSVKLCDSLQRISEEAFARCVSLVDISLAWGRMSFVNPMAFAGCTSIKEIYFPGYMIVTPGLFMGCGSVETVYLNDKVVHIGQQSFAGCVSLKRIYIYDSTTEIDDNAFNKCDSLSEIIYSGSENQWKKIKISNVGNEVIYKASVSFNNRRGEECDQ